MIMEKSDIKKIKELNRQYRGLISYYENLINELIISSYYNCEKIIIIWIILIQL